MNCWIGEVNTLTTLDSAMRRHSLLSVRTGESNLGNFVCDVSGCTLCLLPGVCFVTCALQLRCIACNTY